MSKKGTADPLKFFSERELDILTAPGKPSPEARRLQEIAGILQSEGTRAARSVLRDFRGAERSKPKTDPMQVFNKSELNFLTNPSKDASATNLLSWIKDEVQKGNPDAPELLRLFREAKKENWASVRRDPNRKKLSTLDRLISYRGSDGESFEIDPRDDDDSDVYEAAK